MPKGKEYLRERQSRKKFTSTEQPMTNGSLPTEATARKSLPLASGVLDYFPDALVAVAEVSKAGNDQHNPGQPLHWDRSKSNDHADSLLRHLLERGSLDTDGLRHSAKVAWRALALLQVEIEKAREAAQEPDWTGSVKEGSERFNWGEEK